MKLIIDISEQTYNNIIKDPFLNNEIYTAIKNGIQLSQGHWILKIEDWNRWVCSECNYTERTDIHTSLGYDFCPKCGAKMIIDDNN